jgi:hypothetical protein
MNAHAVSSSFKGGLSETQQNMFLFWNGYRPGLPVFESDLQLAVETGRGTGSLASFGFGVDSGLVKSEQF